MRENNEQDDAILKRAMSKKYDHGRDKGKGSSMMLSLWV